MAITLISGVPGAGKTLLAVDAIYDQVQKNRNPKTPPEERRPIYTDIDGIDFGDDVDFYDGDWRELPDGSLIIFDEVHRRWPTSGRSGMSNDETCSQLDMHRHRGMDFILITQWPTKLHFEARTNVTRHKHLLRISGSHNATVFIWEHAQSSPDSNEAKATADTEVFRYPKHLFKHYKSATIHTHKLRIPKKLLFYAALALMFFGGALYLFFTNDSGFLAAGLRNVENEPVIQVSGVVGVQTSALPVAQPTRLETIQQLAGCISNSQFCMCYDDKGNVLNLELAMCLNQMEQPLPFPLRIESKS